MNWDWNVGKLGALLLRRFLILANFTVALVLVLVFNPFTLLASLIYLASAYWLTDHFERRHSIGIPIEIRMIISLVLFIEIATR